LGGGEVKLLDHVGAFATFANDGVFQKPVSILKVEAPDGSVLQESTPSDGSRVFDSQIARLISNVLSDDGARAYVFGGRGALTLPGRPAAAKSGTTNNYKDAWTMGYTPSLAAGVWVGNSRGEEMKRGADGSIIAAPIWQQFMKDATKGTPVESFQSPAPSGASKSAILGTAFEKTVKIDTITGKLAVESTPPEDIQEQTFIDPHSILYYVNKDDPTGPAPSNPAQDPQFNAWESAVQTWVQHAGWNATSTPPTEYDDVHTKDNIPMVNVVTPSDQNRIESRMFTISVDVSASRSIQSVSALMNGYVLGSSFTAGQNGRWTIDATIPNAIGRGFQDLIVKARDDVGNLGTAKVTINLAADPILVGLDITDPTPGQALTMDQFPKNVSVSLNDVTNIQRVDLYLQTRSGEIKLIGSNIKPQSSPATFNWSYLEGPGSYTLHAEAETSNSQTLRGDAISVTVSPKKLDMRGMSTSTKATP
jgi:membrane carboxypeptidase/penicillin-binding protein PbpC